MEQKKHSDNRLKFAVFRKKVDEGVLKIVIFAGGVAVGIIIHAELVS